MTSVVSAEPASVSRIMGVTRSGITHKIEIQDATHGGVIEGYVTGNLSEAGELREVFLHGFGKEGSTLAGWTQLAAISTSLGLQAGVDFTSFAARVAQMRFEPYGQTANPDIPWAPSVPAYIVAWLALRFGDDSARTAMRTRHG
ncbi:MAG: hypothetical protein LC798_15485 [Chloroflexi bacterium]|nr:hypothetical protein [Chloroflexota bacterium]